MKYFFTDRNIEARMPEVSASKPKHKKGNDTRHSVQNNHYLIKADAYSHISVCFVDGSFCAKKVYGVCACVLICGFAEGSGGSRSPREGGVCLICACD